jgi:hypothetical protein
VSIEHITNKAKQYKVKKKGEELNSQDHSGNAGKFI